MHFFFESMKNKHTQKQKNFMTYYKKVVRFQTIFYIDYKTTYLLEQLYNQTSLQSMTPYDIWKNFNTVIVVHKIIYNV